ncbi:PqqD family protein [Candidatus Omnitrophota bacterium]
MEASAVIRKNPNMVTRVIGDERILVPIYKTSDDISCIYSLNKVAARVWEMFDGKKPLSQVKKQVLKEFDTTPRQADKELEKLLKDLKEIKAVV